MNKWQVPQLMLTYRHLVFFLSYSALLADAYTPPRITIIFVVDQFASSYLHALQPYMRHPYGINFLLTQGIHYRNAVHPHAMPATATGHAALNTGSWACDHGIIGNSWYNDIGKKINADDDTSERAAVFSPTGLYPYGKSANNLMIDGLSDQFMLACTETTPRIAYSVSLKSRAAIMTAGKLGKAIWFDEYTGCFTSSIAYFKALPEWLLQANSLFARYHTKNWYWSSVYPLNSAAYAFVHKDSYKHAAYPATWLHTRKPIKQTNTKKAPFEMFMLTPHANQLVLDLAEHTLKHGTHPNDQILLWVCLSSLDKIGHEFGQQSYENVDMLYHLDCQIGRFIEKLYATYNPQDILFVLTADHGVTPTIELVHAQGYNHAQRVIASHVLKELNNCIKRTFGIPKLVIGYQPPQIFVNMELFERMPQTLQKNIVVTLKKEIKKYPIVREVWSFNELQQACFEPFSINFFFKKQLYPGRSGLITYKPFPYTTITNYKKGTSHRSPFWYNTHVPLALYRQGILQHQLITENVYTLQLANTLADLLNIPRPTMSYFNALPGIKYDGLLKNLHPVKKTSDSVLAPKN